MVCQTGCGWAPLLCRSGSGGPRRKAWKFQCYPVQFFCNENVMELVWRLIRSIFFTFPWMPDVYPDRRACNSSCNQEKHLFIFCLPECHQPDWQCHWQIHQNLYFSGILQQFSGFSEHSAPVPCPFPSPHSCQQYWHFFFLQMWQIPNNLYLLCSLILCCFPFPLYSLILRQYLLWEIQSRGSVISHHIRIVMEKWNEWRIHILNLKHTMRVFTD